MAIKLAELRNNAKTIPVTFGDETLNVTYKVNDITPDFLLKMADAPNRRVFIINKLVTSWELVGDDGQECPRDEATLSTLPISFLDTLGGAMLSDLSPKVKGVN